MSQRLSALFRVSPAEWLGVRLDSGRQDVCSINDRIVLFNAESKDKVISMFKRLQLQDDATALKPYCVMDTEGFRQTYQQTICRQSETQPIKQS